MAAESPDTRIRLIGQGPDLWRVQVLFEDGLEELIPEKLREIKIDLAKGFGVPLFRKSLFRLFETTATQSKSPSPSTSPMRPAGEPYSVTSMT